MISYGLGVQLGPLDSSHSEIIRKWRNDFSVWKWTRQNDLISETGHAEWFKKQAYDPSIQMYAIFQPDKPDIIGVCGLTSIDFIHSRAEFSLYISPMMRGNQLGSKALHTLVSHGFNSLNINSIWGETFEGNSAIKIFNAMGFKKDGVRREFYYKSGKKTDAILISILKSEWERDPKFKKEPVCSMRAMP